MLNNKLAKLTIDSYEEKERTSKLGSFEIMFNPSSLSFDHENKYSEGQGINTSAAEARYQHTAPKSLELELIIDTVNIYKNVQATSVKEKVEEFLRLFVMNGDIHQPPFLKIHWGEMQWGWSSSSAAFDCRISAVNITYTLFARDGAPLRATLNTKFIEDIIDKKRVNLEKKNSPDLTHTRIVTSGSTLPLFAQQIYQNPLFYLEIARHNNLDNLREIKPGTTLNFPPIKNEIERKL